MPGWRGKVSARASVTEPATTATHIKASRRVTDVTLLLDDEQPVVRRMQELDALFHQHSIVLDRDAKFLAAPLRDRRVREELEREDVLTVHLERRLERLPRREGRTDVMSG